MIAVETKTRYLVTAETVFQLNEYLLSTEDGEVMFNKLNNDLLKNNIELYKTDKIRKRNTIIVNRKAKRLLRYLAKHKSNIKLSLDMVGVNCFNFKLIIQEKTIVVYYYTEIPEEIETLHIVIDSENNEFYKQVILTFNSGTDQEYERPLQDLFDDIQWLRY